MTHPYLLAYERHKIEAQKAFDLYSEHCNNAPPPRVPGVDTVIRLAWRIQCGHSIYSAAAREYLYRWNLAIKPFDQIGYNGAVSVFGAPHTIGL